MFRDNKILLENNWNTIEKRVILPLWKGKYESMYSSLKLDYDDFVSMSGYELSKSISSYDDKKSNLYTFVTNVIKRKANTELRDYGSRDKRKALAIADSLNACVDSDDERYIDIPCKEQEEISPLVQRYIDSLSKKQRRIAELIMEGYDNTSIKSMLGLSSTQFGLMYERMKSNEKTDILNVLKEKVI